MSAPSLSERIGCSTISFQHLPLEAALSEIDRLGFSQFDLGALPGVCDHVPTDLDAEAIEEISALVRSSGLRARSVNGDIGDLNSIDADRGERLSRLTALIDLSARTGADALVLPCGSRGHEPMSTLPDDLDRVAGELARAASIARVRGVEIWVESLHYLRLSWNRERAEALHARLEGSGVRPILDVAHVVAAGDDVEDVVTSWGARIAHVHVRDAVPGDFNAPFGTGDVDLARTLRALDAIGYTGAYALELPSSAYSDDATDAIDADAARAKSTLVDRAAADLNTVITSLHPTEGTES